MAQPQNECLASKTVVETQVSFSERLCKLLQREPCLLDQAFECPGFDRSMHGNDDGSVIASEDEVRAGLTDFFKSQTL